jgi:hypothetical protein
MCILVTKKLEQGSSVRAQSRIVVLGNKYDWVMQNTPPSDLAKCELAPSSSSIYSWLSNEPLGIKNQF